jgi:hypothetical protein
MRAGQAGGRIDNHSLARYNACMHSTAPGRLGQLPDRDQMSVLVGTIVFGFTLVRFVELPAHEIGTEALGSAIGLSLSTTLTMLIVLASLTATGMDSLLRSHPKAQAAPQSGAFVLWGLPVLTVVALQLGLSRLPGNELWWLGLAGSGIAVALVLAAEYISFDPEHPLYLPVQLLMTGLVYVLALALFTAIYESKGRALLTGTVASSAAAILALRMLWMHVRRLGPVLLYAGAVGVVVGECMWALGYSRAAPLAAGLLLLLIFYLGAGLSQAALQRTFGRRTLIEFGIVAAVGLVIVLRYVL